MKKAIQIACVAVVVVGVGSIAMAEVNIETVPVGNPGNVGELSGQGAGDEGPDRICGAVHYDYNIGKYEVTAGQYTEFLNSIAGVDTYGLYNAEMWSNDYGCKIERYDGSGASGDPYQYRIAGDRADRPVNWLSWGDAARFANWLHNAQPSGAQNAGTTEDGAYYLNGATGNAALLAVNRQADWKWAITSEDEWYKAAYYSGSGGTYYDYPTGSDSVPTAETPLGGSNSANYAWAVGNLTDAGAYMSSDSPYGTFDQGGNVWEWNEAIVYESSRGLRSGSFGSGHGSILLASARNYYFPPSLENSYIGFRVSQVPEPATLGLLALGGLAVLRRRSPGRRRLLRRKGSR